MEAEFDVALTAVANEFDPATIDLETIELKPRRTDIDVETVALAWLPCEQGADGSLTALV
jgi:hypothetical protein